MVRGGCAPLDNEHSKAAAAAPRPDIYRTAPTQTGAFLLNVSAQQMSDLPVLQYFVGRWITHHGGGSRLFDGQFAEFYRMLNYVAERAG